MSLQYPSLTTLFISCENNIIVTIIVAKLVTIVCRSVYSSCLCDVIHVFVLNRCNEEQKAFLLRTLILKLFVLFNNSHNHLSSLNYLNPLHKQWRVEDSEDKNMQFTKNKKEQGNGTLLVIQLIMLHKTPPLHEEQRSKDIRLLLLFHSTHSHILSLLREDLHH